MPFSYNSTNPEKIVFTRKNPGFIRFVSLAIGIIFSVTGLFLIYFTKGSAMPLAVLKYVVPVFGALGIYMSIKLPEIQGETIPDEIIFDNTQGRAEVKQKTSGVHTAYIYYDEMADFVSIAKSKSNTNNTLKTYTYHVLLNKKDGGQWELLKLNSEQAAMNEIARLKSLIKLDVSPKREAVTILPSEKYTIRRDQQKVELYWRNPLGFGPLILGAFALAFACVFYAVGSFVVAHDNEVVTYIVLGFIGAVFMIVIIGNILKLIKNGKTDYSLAITKSSLVYLEKDKSGRIMKEDRYPFEELHSIAYSFDSEESSRKIYIYTKKQHEQKSAMKPALSVEYIRSVIAFHTSLHALDIQSLTPVEALYIENYLQEQIREIGNAEVA